MQAAFRILARELYGPVCPHEGRNDITISMCCHATGILKVHSRYLAWELDAVHKLPELKAALHTQVTDSPD
jgi:hypothetical protein